MSDRLTTIDMGRKDGKLLCHFRGELGIHLTQCGLGKWRLDPSSRLTTTDKSRKLGAVVPPFLGEGELGLHLIQCGQGIGAYLRFKWHLDPSSRLATIHGLKSGG